MLLWQPQEKMGSKSGCHGNIVPVHDMWYYSRQPETQVLDYQTQQYKILPLIATAHAMMAASQQILATYYELLGEIFEGNAEVLAEVRCAPVSFSLRLSFWLVWVRVTSCNLAKTSITVLNECGTEDYSLFLPDFSLTKTW